MGELLAAYSGIGGGPATPSPPHVRPAPKPLPQPQPAGDGVVRCGGGRRPDALCRLTLKRVFGARACFRAYLRSDERIARRITIGEGACLFLMTRGPGGMQLLGVGESSDAYHISAPDPEGRGAESAMRAALQDAGLEPEAVAYINLSRHPARCKTI